MEKHPNTDRLSELQKQIILLASRDPRGYIEACTVLNQVYGFPIVRHGRGTRFDGQQISLKRYLAATVATCKSLNRLGARGFGLRVPGRGLTLTEKGKEAAERIRQDMESGYFLDNKCARARI